MITRRRFLSSAAAAPFLIAGARPAPGERITMGLIGCGGMGLSNMIHFMKLPDCQFVAVCDVEREFKDHGREPARQAVEKHYGTRGCDVYEDFRELCARKDIDAVVVATPDHWHARVALEALRNGKDVYGEKPVTHLFGEARVLVEAVAKHGRIWQTGSQQRSEVNFRRAAELVRNGVIGKVKQVEIGLPRGHEKAFGDLRVKAPPETLNYDLWCGPARKLDYIPARLHGQWRWNLNTGGGQIMDWIGHHNDIAHWGLGRDLGGPVEVQAVGFKYPEDRSIWDAAYEFDIHCLYEDGVATSISHANKQGIKWIGEGGWVFVSRTEFVASDPAWVKPEFNPGPVRLYESNDHRRNFLDGVKTRKPCVTTAEISHRSITPGHLGMVSDALGGRKLKWDPAKEEVVGDPEADALLKKVEYRTPWTL